MITENLIRKVFVHQTIKNAMQEIQSKWKPAVGAFNVRSGELRSFADHPMPIMQIADKKFSVHYFIPLHMRFLDIQYRKKKGKRGDGGRNLYNKIVWPVVYQQMYPELRRGFTDEVRKQIGDRLRQAAEITKKR